MKFMVGTTHPHGEGRGSVRYSLGALSLGEYLYLTTWRKILEALF